MRAPRTPGFVWLSSVVLCSIVADGLSVHAAAEGELRKDDVTRKRLENGNSNRRPVVDNASFEQLWDAASQQADREMESERFLREIMSMSVPSRPNRPTRAPVTGPPSPTRVPTPTPPTLAPVPTPTPPTRAPSPSTPTGVPVPAPTRVPGPTLPTRFPIPTERPTRSPTREPSPPTRAPVPTDEPSSEPTAPTASPAPTSPSAEPSSEPSEMPIVGPQPTRVPTQPTRRPTLPPDPSVTPAPTPVCVEDDKEAFLLEILEPFTPESELLDMSTPQGMAYFFLVSEDPSFVCSPTVIQRYGLATLYFATDGARWTNNDGWLSPTQECDWFGVECGNSNQFALQLSLRK